MKTITCFIIVTLVVLLSTPWLYATETSLTIATGQNGIFSGKTKINRGDVP